MTGDAGIKRWRAAVDLAYELADLAKDARARLGWSDSTIELDIEDDPDVEVGHLFEAFRYANMVPPARAREILEEYLRTFDLAEPWRVKIEHELANALT